MRRISGLPRALECPSSELPTDHPYDPPAPVADSGSAAHMALYLKVAGHEPDLDKIALEYDVDRDELGFLYGFGLKAWNQIKQHFPNVRAEEQVEAPKLGLRGTMDIFGIDSSVMAVADWKSNYVMRDVRDQVLGYAAACVETYGMPPSGFVTCAVIWLRFGEVEVFNATQAELDRFHRRRAKAKRRIGKSYSPGDMCEFCPRRLECKAKTSLVSSSATALTAMDSYNEVMGPEQLGKLHSRARFLKKALEQYDKALRLALRDGPILDQDGNTLQLEVQTREKLKAREAWGVLDDAGFSDDELAECIKLSKTAVMKVVGAKTEKGKGKAKAAMAETLREAGAVDLRAHETIKVRKATK